MGILSASQHAGGVRERDLAGQLGAGCFQVSGGLGADRLDLGLGGIGAGGGGQLRADAAELAEDAVEAGLTAR